LSLLLLSACGAADATRADGSASLEAVLSIERLEEAGHSDAPSASAMAQFVILPSDADVHDTLGAAGLRAQLPEHAGCVDLVAADAAASARRRSAGATNGLRYSLREPLELLEAGDVSIRAGDMLTRLALNSFPPSGSASGVVYTTPDQSAEPLPPDESYAILATGSSSIPPIRIVGRAPLALADVTVGGQPLERPAPAAAGVVATDPALDTVGAPLPPQFPQQSSRQAAPLSLTAGQPLDITWSVGSAGDRIYVELADAEHSLACAFPDEDGAGTVPGTLTGQLRADPTSAAAGSPVRLSVHRVREVVQPETAPEEAHPESPGYGLSLETTVRFDFETTALVRVQ
jgi:hypothetical protein